VISKAVCHLATCAQVSTAVLSVTIVGSREDVSKCRSKTWDEWNGKSPTLTNGMGLLWDQKWLTLTNQIALPTNGCSWDFTVVILSKREQDIDKRNA